MTEEIERLKRRCERERAARKEAEQLLEEKARELFHANDQLRHLLEVLEDKVNSRTEDLRIALAEAERAGGIKNEFLAMISHEIRTPMNAVHGMAQLLQDSGLKSEQQEMAQLIVQSSQALLRIVNDLLDLSKVEAGKLELELVNFSLGAIIEEVVEIYDRRAKAKGLTIRADIDESLQRSYRGDPGRLRQVLMNFVDNAIKYSDSGTITLRAESKGRSGATHQTHFSVTDQGTGIPEQMRSRLFQKFDRMGLTGNRGIEGTGLGLALCKQLVDLMNGTIGVEPLPAPGATFWFRIPLTLVEQPRSNEPTVCANSTEAKDASLNQQQTTRPLRILVAEDNPANQMVIKLMLQNLGHRIEVANNGIEAVEAVRLAPYDLVLMDMQMPELDGLDATRQIRSLEGKQSALPIIALTANAMERDRQLCLSAGMNGFLSKPISRAALASALVEFSD